MSDSKSFKRNRTDLNKFTDEEIAAATTEIVMDKTALPNSSVCDVTPLPSLAKMPTISLNKHRIPIGGPVRSFPPCQNNPEVDEYHGNGYCSAATWEDRHGGVLEKENNQGRCGGRGRTTYSDDQITELEKVFSNNPYPTPQSRQRLARGINVPEGKVKIWFQNRRARAKKQRNPGNGWRCGSMRVSYPLSLSSVDKGSKKTESGKALFYRFQSNGLASGSVTELNALAASYLSSGNNISVDSGPLSLSHLSLCNPDKSTSKRETTAETSSSCLFTSNFSSLSTSSSEASATSSHVPLPKSSNSIPNFPIHPESAESNEEQPSMYPPRFPVIHKRYGSSCQFGGQLISSNGSFFTEVPGYPPSSGANGIKKPAGLELSQSYNSSIAYCSAQDSGDFVNSLRIPPSSAWSNVNNKPTGNDNLHIGSKEPVFQTANTSMSSNSGTFMQSPPPIRRFVFPFKTLLENARYTQMNLPSAVDQGIPQQTSDNSCYHLPKVNSENSNEEFRFSNDSNGRRGPATQEDTCELKENKKSLSPDEQFQHQLEVHDLHGVDRRHQVVQIDRQRHWPVEFSSGATCISNNLSDTALQSDDPSSSWYPNITASHNSGSWNYSNCSQTSDSSVLRQQSHNHRSDVRRSDEEEWRGHIFPPGGKISTSTPVVR